MPFVLWSMDPWNTIQHMPWNTTSFAKRHSQPMQTYHFSFLQVLELGQSGGDGQSATHLGQVATSSDLAIATMLPRLLPAMATQLKQLHAQMPLRLTFLTKSSPTTKKTWQSIAVTQTTRSSSPPVGWESAVLEIVQLLVPHSVLRETAPETVHILLRRRKLSILKQKVGYR